MDWDLKPDDAVDGWKLVKMLDRGGNGEVWVAEHQTWGKAALKLLKLRFQCQEEKRYLRFRDEAKMHGQLSQRHSGVLPFLACSLPDSPTRETPAWLATKVAQSARNALKGKPLPAAIEAVASVAETLAALHEENVSHRDVKPNNLFWFEDRWVVGDYGLVDYPDKDSLTDTGERLGPFHYLAPEMHIEANRSDGRMADVYSLGKTLWVLGTEQHVAPPGELRADNGQLCIRMYRAAPRTEQLDLLIERATRHNPTQRPTMAEFAAELRAWLTSPEEPAKPDLTEVFARIRALTPPAMRSAADRTKLEKSVESFREKLSAGIGVVGRKLAETGLSNGHILGTIPADPFFQRHLSDSPFWGTNFLCSAALPAGSRTVNLSCIVVVHVYHDSTTQFCGGYRVGLGGATDRLIGVKKWTTVLGSATHDQAVVELFNSLNESLGESLTILAEWGERASPRPKTS